jgi:hypothetical protein
MEHVVIPTRAAFVIILSTIQYDSCLHSMYIVLGSISVPEVPREVVSGRPDAVWAYPWAWLTEAHLSVSVVETL